MPRGIDAKMICWEKCLGKIKGGRERVSLIKKKKQNKEPSDCSSGLKPVKKREAGGLDEESLGLQCCSG